jgi:hypothetical protein
MTISLRLNDNEAKLVKAYAKICNMSYSEMFRRALFEKIEDEFDIKDFAEAKAEHEANPKTFTFDEVLKMLNLENKV